MARLGGRKTKKISLGSTGVGQKNLHGRNFIGGLPTLQPLRLRVAAPGSRSVMTQAGGEVRGLDNRHFAAMLVRIEPVARRNRPTHLRIVEGRRDRRPAHLRDREPAPTGALAEPPDWLSADQREGWHYVIANAPLGLLKRLDRAMLTAWVVAEALHREASIKLRNSSLLIKTTQGAVIQSPLLGIINRQAVLMKALAVELGFSPAARTRISCEPEEDFDDPTDRFFRK